MTFTEDWAELLTWEVEVTVPTGKDGFGNETWSTPVTILAHVDQVTTSDRQSDREITQAQLVRAGTIYWGCDAGITPVPRARVTFPYGLEVDLGSIVQHFDEDGAAHHWECQWEAVT